MQRQLHEINNMSVFERAKLFERLSIYPALTLMVFTRWDIGFRLLHPVAVPAVTFAMWLIAAFTDSSAIPKLLYYHGWAFAILCGFQRVRRWRSFSRGVKQHSYYLGTSLFDVRWPRFVRRNRLVARFAEPFLWLGVAFVLFGKGYKAEAFWIGFCAVCLRAHEEAVHRMQRDRDMDMIDGLVMSEIHSGTVEQFSEPTAATSAAPAVASGGAIPTGLSPELKALMARRPKQADQPPNPASSPVAPGAAPKNALTLRRIGKALAVALAVDTAQGLVTLALIKTAFFHAWSPMQLYTPAVVADLLAAIAAIAVLGFQWRFLFAFLVELVPLIHAVPFWTFAVAIGAWKRRKDIVKAPRAEPPPAKPAPETVLQVVANPGPSVTPDVPRAIESPILSHAPLAARSQTATIPPAPKPQTEAAAEVEPTSNLLVSRESLVISVLVVPAILLTFWLLHGLHRPEAKVAGISGTDQLTRVMTRAAQRRVDNAKRRCDSIIEQFEAIAKPGPEPDPWEHPIDYVKWSARQEAYNTVAAAFRKELEEARRAQEDAATELAGLTADLATVTDAPAVQSEVKSIWSRYIVPPLHLLFAFSLLRFTARTLFRFLLLKDRIGAIQL